MSMQQTIPSIEQLFNQVFSWMQDDLAEIEIWEWLREVVVWRREQLGQSYAMYAAVLPILATLQAGGDYQKAIPLAAAWILQDLASDIFDDLQDKDLKPHPWYSWPAERTMLIGVGLLFAGQHCLARLDTSALVGSDIQQRWSQTGLWATRYQQPSEMVTAETYFDVITAKSGIIVSTVMWCGGRLATTETGTLSALEAYGLALGILIQLCDDGRDLAGKNNSYEPTLLSQLHELIRMVYTKAHRTPGSPINGSMNTENEVGMHDPAFPLLAYSFLVHMMEVYENKAISALAPFAEGTLIPLIEYARHFRCTVSQPLSNVTQR